MTQYIDKSALVTEIKRRIILLGNNFDGIISMLSSVMFVNEYKDLLSFLNTLEVKEVDLENSMTCKVGWYDGFLLDYTQEQQDELLKKIDANVGDKIIVILAKE